MAHRTAYDASYRVSSSDEGATCWRAPHVSVVPLKQNSLGNQPFYRGGEVLTFRRGAMRGEGGRGYSSSVASEYLQCQLIFQLLRKGIFIKTIIASTQREAQPRKRGMVVVEVHGATRICDGGGRWGGRFRPL